MSDCNPYIPMVTPARIGWSVARFTSQAVQSAVVTAVTFDTEVFDSNGFFTPGNSSASIAPSKAGVYALTASIYWDRSGLGTWPFARITAGGVAYDANGLTAGGIHTVSVTVALAAGDAVVVDAYQNVGATANILRARFSGYLIAL